MGWISVALTERWPSVSTHQFLPPEKLTGLWESDSSTQGPAKDSKCPPVLKPTMIYFSVIFPSNREPLVSQILTQPNFHLGHLKLDPFLKTVDKSQRNGAAFQRQQRKSQNRFALLLYTRFPSDVDSEQLCRLKKRREEPSGSPLSQTPHHTPSHLLYVRRSWQASVKKTFLDRRRTASDAWEQALSAAAFRNLFDTFPHYFGGADHSRRWEKNKRSSELLLQMEVLTTTAGNFLNYKGNKITVAGVLRRLLFYRYSAINRGQRIWLSGWCWLMNLCDAWYLWCLRHLSRPLVAQCLHLGIWAQWCSGMLYYLIIRREIPLKLHRCCCCPMRSRLHIISTEQACAFS